MFLCVQTKVSSVLLVPARDEVENELEFLAFRKQDTWTQDMMYVIAYLYLLPFPMTPSGLTIELNIKKL